MKPIRLLAIIEATTITGPAKNLLQFARIARGDDPPVEVSIAVFQRPGQSGLFLETVRQSSLPCYAIPETGKFDRSVGPALLALGQQLKPDLVQSHAVKSHFLVRKSGLGRLAPWLAFHHGYTWPDLRTRLYNQLDRWSLPAATRVVTVSRPFQQELIRKGVDRKRIEIIHNAIDPQWGRSAREPRAAAALRSQLGLAAGSKVILIVGRLSREKDHISLLRAIVPLRELDPHLVIVGDGPERENILSTIQELDLGGRVTLAGQVPSAEPYYGIADAAVLSSLSEGSPNALLEAMAAGVPVVSTEVGGVPEIVTNRESALLVARGDVVMMGSALREVLTSPALAEALTKRAYELVVTRHAPQVRVKRLIEVYTAVLANQQQYCS